MQTTKNANSKPSKSTEDMYLRGIPKGLKALYKSVCALNGISMRASIIEHMRAKCKRVNPE
jgi:hypothetical protein